jgi:hypothetical protein
MTNPVRDGMFMEVNCIVSFELCRACIAPVGNDM